MSATNDNLANKYQQKTDKQHILDNPDTYIGSIENVESDLWVLDAPINNNDDDSDTISLNDITNKEVRELSEKDLNKIITVDHIKNTISMVAPDVKVVTVRVDKKDNK